MNPQTGYKPIHVPTILLAVLIFLIINVAGNLVILVKSFF